MAPSAPDRTEARHAWSEEDTRVCFGNDVLGRGMENELESASMKRSPPTGMSMGYGLRSTEIPVSSHNVIDLLIALVHELQKKKKKKRESRTKWRLVEAKRR